MNTNGLHFRTQRHGGTEKIINSVPLRLCVLKIGPFNSDGPIFGSGGSDGVVFDGHTRGYAPTVGTHPAHPPEAQRK